MTHSFMAPITTQTNETRLLAWSHRVFEHIEREYAWLFQEYAPSQWRLRLPCTGLDLGLATNDDELVVAARKWFKLLRDQERKE